MIYWQWPQSALDDYFVSRSCRVVVVQRILSLLAAFSIGFRPWTTPLPLPPFPNHPQILIPLLSAILQSLPQKSQISHRLLFIIRTWDCYAASLDTIFLLSSRAIVVKASVSDGGLSINFILINTVKYWWFSSIPRILIRQQRIFYGIIKKLNIAVARLARDLQINGLIIVVIHLVVWLAIVDLSAVSRSYYPQSTPDTPTLAGWAAALATKSTEVKVTGASHVGFTLHFMNLNTALTCTMPPQRHWQTGLRPRLRNARLDSVFATVFFLMFFNFSRETWCRF